MRSGVAEWGKAAPACVAAAKSVGTGEGDDLLVVEAKTKWLILVYHWGEENVLTPCGRRSVISGLAHEKQNKGVKKSYVPQVIRTLRGVGKTAIRGRLWSKTVNAAWTPRDLGALHFLLSVSTQ